jgi:beta-xylosidase
VLNISRMSADGAKLLDDGFLVYDGHAADPTIEGPKLYKRNGYYYILAPGGGVPTGWEVALRSKNIYGPYERRVVLSQGSTPINGPHQGAWVDTPNGESWFLHFQDKGAYGRIVHLQPVKWVDDWPVMGDNGHPVLTYKKPAAGKGGPVITPADSDEFEGTTLGLQWQWQANPKPGWAFPYERKYLRLMAVPLAEGMRNFWDIPNVLLQKFPAPWFTVATSLNLTSVAGGEKAGLIVMGLDYAYASIRKTAAGYQVAQAVCRNADRGSVEKETAPVTVKSGAVEMRVRVSEGGVCQFGYRADGGDFTDLGEPFTARPGRWIGAKVGLFAVRSGAAGESGYADVDWFRVDQNGK